LTHREREIFALIATGYDNDQIAEKLGLAVQTVRNQVSTIYSKLGVKDRFEIIRVFNRNPPR
jgi:DNA-binding NarL/FixJ family response regulator